MANYIDVTEIASYNPNLDTSLYTTTTLSGLITRASTWIDNYLNYTLPLETITLEKQEGRVDSDGNLVIFTQKIPIVSVEAINIVKGTQTVALSLLDGTTPRYDILNTARKSQIIFPNNQLALSGASRIRTFYDLRGIRFYTTVSYTAGYQTIPEDIKQATLLLVTDMIASNINSIGASSVSQGGVSYTFAQNSGGDSDKVQDAKQILNNYKRWTGF